MNWICRGSRALSTSDSGSSTARKQSQAEDGLISVSAKDGKDDDNLWHTQNKSLSPALPKLRNASLLSCRLPVTAGGCAAPHPQNLPLTGHAQASRFPSARALLPVTSPSYSAPSAHPPRDIQMPEYRSFKAWLTQDTETLLRTLTAKAEALVGQSWVIRGANEEPHLLPKTPMVLWNATGKPLIWSDLFSRFGG